MWRSFPLAFLGFGCLYAWGYVSWSTDALATQAVSGVALDASWVVSASVVPIALVILALLSRRFDLERMGWLYAVAPVLAAVGSVLSVAYQYVGHPTLATFLAVVSGAGTAGASALFGMLWYLALSRLNAATLEVVVPLTFVASALCALVVPSMAQVPALVVALLLVLVCAASLWHVRTMLATGTADARWLEESERPAVGAPEAPEASVGGIARMLVFGVVAWGVMNILPTGLPDAATPSFGIDARGFVGYLFAILYALLIIRYAVRVDFQALALMTLPPLVLSVMLFSLGGPVATFWAGVLNVGLNSCCEIILLLYFVRIAQGRPCQRAFWLGLGSAASYLGVFLGQLGDALCARAGILAVDPALFCLGVVCVYAFAMMLIPQRTAPMGGGEADLDTCASRGATAIMGLSGARGGRMATAGSTAAEPLGAHGAGGEEPANSGDPDAIAVACERIARECQLSTREAEVCAYLARGRSQTYIRDALLLSKNTVSTHVRRLYAKLGVHSKQELIDLVERHR